MAAFGYCWAGYFSRLACSIVRLITPIGFTGVALGLDDNLLLHTISLARLISAVISRYIRLPLFSVTLVTLDGSLSLSDSNLFQILFGLFSHSHTGSV